MKAENARSTAAALTALVLVALAPGIARADDTPVDASAVASADKFSFRTDTSVSVKQALALFARANNLNIVPDLDIDGQVTVEFQNLPLDLAMRAILDANGYYFVKDRDLIRVRNRETRLFHVDYIDVTRSGQGSSAVQISAGGGSSGGGGSGGGASSGGGGGGGGSGSEGSSMTVSATSTIDFWGTLASQLKSMVSQTGAVTVNSLAGTIQISDTHRNIENIATYLASVTDNVERQVDLEVQIYEVAFSDNFQLGIDWYRIQDSLASSFGTIPGALGKLSGAASPLIGSNGLPVIKPLSDAGGLIVQSSAYGASPLPGGFQWEHHDGGTSLIVNALKQQGNLKVVSKPHLRTLNNQPAVVRVGQDIPVFIRQVISSPGSPPVITTNESVQNVTVGTVLSITPQIAANGLITLDISPAVSRLVRVATSASGDTNAPVIDIRQASSLVRVRDGDTIIMGGLVQDSSSTTTRKIPLLGDIPFLGKAFSGESTAKERTELIFFLTPHVVRESAPQK